MLAQRVRLQLTTAAGCPFATEQEQCKVSQNPSVERYYLDKNNFAQSSRNGLELNTGSNVQHPRVVPCNTDRDMVTITEVRSWSPVSRLNLSVNSNPNLNVLLFLEME